MQAFGVVLKTRRVVWLTAGRVSILAVVIFDAARDASEIFTVAPATVLGGEF